MLCSLRTQPAVGSSLLCPLVAMLRVATPAGTLQRLQKHAPLRTTKLLSDALFDDPLELQLKQMGKRFG